MGASSEHASAPARLLMHLTALPGCQLPDQGSARRTPVLTSVDTLLIENLLDDEEDVFAAALDA